MSNFPVQSKYYTETLLVVAASLNPVRIRESMNFNSPTTPAELVDREMG